MVPKFRYLSGFFYKLPKEVISDNILLECYFFPLVGPFHFLQHLNDLRWVGVEETSFQCASSSLLPDLLPGCILRSFSAAAGNLWNG